jgi:hypothetical protein
MRRSLSEPANGVNASAHELAQRTFSRYNKKQQPGRIDMTRLTSVLALIFLLLPACGADDGSGEEDLTVAFPHTVTLGPEQGLVARTGEILDHADFINADLITYKNQSIKLQTGCPSNQTDCQPLHICRVSPQSKPAIFADHSDVCMNDAGGDDPSIVPNAETGIGFTIALNTEPGFARFWVKEVSGFGDSAKVTLVYSLFHMPE